MTSDRDLSIIERRLRAHYGPPTGPGLSDPFALLLWEQVAYLVDDERRMHAFRLLEERVGLTPQAILKAAPETLTDVAAAGGSIAAEERGHRMQRSALEVVERWNGDLRAALALPLPKALRALARFPMIGEPGAEKILLFTRTQPLLALDSNGLRVLLRLGYGEEATNYARSYRSGARGHRTGGAPGLRLADLVAWTAAYARTAPLPPYRAEVRRVPRVRSVRLLLDTLPCGDGARGMNEVLFLYRYSQHAALRRITAQRPRARRSKLRSPAYPPSIRSTEARADTTRCSPARDRDSPSSNSRASRCRSAF
jgi:endonuclease-3